MGEIKLSIVHFCSGTALVEELIEEGSRCILQKAKCQGQTGTRTNEYSLSICASQDTLALFSNGQFLSNQTRPTLPYKGSRILTG